MSAILSCPFCGAITTIKAVLAAHTRQQCEARILDRIEHHEGIVAREREALAALHEAANRDQQVPA